MATVGLRFVVGGNTLTGMVTISDANANRIMVAEAINMGTVGNQATLDALVNRFLQEMIGDTKTIERNANVVADIPVS